jgi:hypothetical protein
LGVSKKVVWHKLNKLGVATECKINIRNASSEIHTRKTYKGVTCLRCLAKKGK